MVSIAPSHRYNQHAQSRQISNNLINKAIAKYGLDPKKTKATKLSGGFQNANYLIEGKKIVFRFYSTGTPTAQKEISVHQFLQNHSVKAPTPLNFFEIENTAIAVFEFIAGELFQDYLQKSPHPNLKLFNQIGQELAKIHQITFDKSGFIGPNFAIDGQFQNFALFIRQYIEMTLDKLSPNRLPVTTVQCLKSLVSKKWPLVLETEPRRQLTHCDFNPKNILIQGQDNPSIAAIWDWEFCLSGNGYIDLGNFFRFSGDYPENAREHFIEGYRLIAGPVHPHWLEISRLLDLGNMCSFLERPENYPRTFKTARAIIESTLDHFGY